MKKLLNLSVLVVFTLVLATSCERQANPKKKEEDAAALELKKQKDKEAADKKKAEDEQAKSKKKSGETNPKDATAAIFPVISASLPGKAPNSSKITNTTEVAKDHTFVLQQVAIAKLTYGIRILHRKTAAEDPAEIIATTKMEAALKSDRYGVDDNLEGPTVGAAMLTIMTEKKQTAEATTKAFADQAKNLSVLFQNFVERYKLDQSVIIEKTSGGAHQDKMDEVSVQTAMMNALIQATPSDPAMLQLSGMTEDGLKKILETAKKKAEEKKK